MSGRLVILPKKSWNVWNQDNREKVKRDERLAREHQEALDKAEKERVQEHNVEQLLQAGATTAAATSTATEPFRLFGDLEEQSKKHAEMVAAKRLQEEKELLEKRRQGIAPWALGEGAAEKAGAVQPWYLQKQGASGSSSGGGDAVPSDDRRKAAEDPMQRHLKQLPPATGTNSSSSSSSSSSNSSRSNAVLAMLSAGQTPVHVPLPVETEEERGGKEAKEKKKKKHHKESKKHKKDKRHRDEGSDDGGGRDRKARRRDTNGSEAAAADADEDAFAALRRKRLERERVERRREAHLLAQVDMYGPGAATGPVLDERTLRYHSQYNPALARPM